jgi:hypothetical protein
MHQYIGARALLIAVLLIKLFQIHLHGLDYYSRKKL